MSNIDLNFAGILAQASQGAYGPIDQVPDGYTVKTRIDDSGTGLSVTIYKELVGNNYIFAFSGTQLSVQDVFSDLTLGMSQWLQNRDLIREEFTLAIAENSNAIFHFTGHSLGGALAQYAAFEYAQGKADENPDMAAPFDLVTFNSLGGELALNNPDLYPLVYDASRMKMKSSSSARQFDVRNGRSGCCERL